MNNTITPAFQLINKSDKAGLIRVITTFFLTSIWTCLCLRIYVRLKVNGPWKWDDNFVAASTIISSARSAIVYFEVARGYGVSILVLSAGNLADIGKALFADDILYILGLTASKLAVAAVCLRIPSFREHSRIIWAAITLCVMWGLSSILLIAADCRPESLRGGVGVAQCPYLAQRWSAIGAIDVITEVVLLAIPIFLLLRLQMSLRLKSIAFIAFGIRIPVIGLSITHLHFLLAEIRSSNPTLQGTYTAAWTQIHLDLCILSTTLTCLSVFLSPSSNELVTRTIDRSEHLNSQCAPVQDAFTPLEKWTSLCAAMSETTNSDFNMMPMLRPDALPQKTTISSPRMSQRAFSHGSGQGIMFQMEWEVHNSRSTEHDLGIYLADDHDRR